MLFFSGALASSGFCIPGGDFAVLQALALDVLAFDPFALFDDGFSPVEVSVGERQALQTLVIALMNIMLDEVADLGFKIARWQDRQVDSICCSVEPVLMAY